MTMKQLSVFLLGGEIGQVICYVAVVAQGRWVGGKFMLMAVKVGSKKEARGKGRSEAR